MLQLCTHLSSLISHLSVIKAIQRNTKIKYGSSFFAPKRRCFTRRISHLSSLISHLSSLISHLLSSLISHLYHVSYFKLLQMWVNVGFKQKSGAVGFCIFFSDFVARQNRSKKVINFVFFRDFVAATFLNIGRPHFVFVFVSHKGR